MVVPKNGYHNSSSEETGEIDVFIVPIRSLLRGPSPRINGEDERHVKLLAQMDKSLPPILVHRETIGADMVFSPSSSKWVATRSGDSVGRYMGAFSFAYSVSFALAPVALAFALSDLRRASWLLLAALCGASIFLFRGRGASE